MQERDDQFSTEGADRPGLRRVSRLILTVFLLLLVLGSTLQALDLHVGILLTQWVLILIPALWYLGRHRVQHRDFARMRMLETRYLSPVLLLTLCTWVLNAFFAFILMTHLARLGFEPLDVLPPPTTPSDLGRYLFLIGISAGVCEEIFFRSAVLSSVEASDGTLAALVFSSLVFALFHGSFTSLINMFFLGLTIGVVVIKTRSIVGGMLQHTLNNALAVSCLYVLTRYETADYLGGIGSHVSFFVGLVALLGYAWSLRNLNRLSPVGSVLKNRQRWLPRGWVNWATVVFVIIAAILMSAELIVGFRVGSPGGL